jgi:hypothetical protein
MKHFVTVSSSSGFSLSLVANLVFLRRLESTPSSANRRLESEQLRSVNSNREINRSKSLQNREIIKLPAANWGFD